MQRNIEILIGRLLTDDAFRQAFLQDPVAALQGFIESGYELTHVEMSAVSATHSTLWSRIAEEIDPRLRKLSINRREQ